MNNFDTAREALETSLDSAGSAMAEHEKWQQSLEAQINNLKAAWQGLSQTFLNSSFLKNGIKFITKLVSVIEKLIKSLGTLGTLGLGAGIFSLFKGAGLKTLTSALSGFGLLLGDIASSSDKFGKKIKNVGTAASAAAGEVSSGMSALSKAGTIIGIAIAAVELLYGWYKKGKEEAAAARQEAIETSNAYLDAAGTFEQAYIKYSGKTDLTAEEESELKTAINGTVDALGDKSSALQDAVNSSDDYLASLERIAQEELKAANTAAKKKRDAAAIELEETAIGWSRLDGTEVSVQLEEGSEAYNIAKKFKYFTSDETLNDLTGVVETASLDLSENADVKEIVDYYNVLLDYQEALSDADLADSVEYERVTAAIDKMSESVKVYTEGVYEAAKAEYQLAEGIPKTAEEYLAMREAILKSEDVRDLSVDTKKSIANSLDSEYKQAFNLSTAEVQARKLVGILDEYGDMEANEMETFLNMRTAVNSNECTVGEYLSKFDDISSMTADWSDESKKEFDASFGLDTDTIKKQYDDAYKYIDRNYLKKLDTTGLHGFDALEYISTETNRIKDLLKGLSANELAAVISLEGKINWESSNDEILKQIEKEARFIEAMDFTIPISVEIESVESLNTAMAESVSATGLSSEAIDALKGRYAELASQGYDLSAMFEETSNGIHLNRNAVNELEQAYASQKLTEANDNLNVLKGRYDELTKEIDNCSDASERAALYKEQQSIVQKINDLGTLAAQYEGLASSYNAWLSAEEAGQERDMYEQIIEGFENIGDEISRGWLDDGAIKFLELMTGKTDLASKSASELKDEWKKLDENITNTSYSVKDFFTTDEEGNSTSTGVYNFLKAIQELESSDTVSSVLGKQFKEIEGIKDLVTVEDGKITAFNFDVVGGDEAIAEALGISEELVQIMLRAADDAGFVVTLDGNWTQFADLKIRAEEANDAIKKLTQTNEDLKKAGFGDYEFNFGAKTVESINEEFKKATELLNNPAFKNAETGKFDSSIEGAKEALKIAETLLIAKQQLEEPAYMSIDTTKLQDKLQEPVKLLKSYEEKAQRIELLSLDPDVNAEEIKTLNGDLDGIVKQLQELPEEQRIAIGIDGMSDKEIREQLENGTIEVPAELTLEANMDKSLEDLVTLGLLEQGLIDEKTAKIRLGLEVEPEVDDSEVNKAVEEMWDRHDGTNKEIKKKQSIQIIAETFGVEDVEGLEAQLENLDDKTIQAIAEVLGRADVDQLKEAMGKLDTVQVDAIAKAIGEGDVTALKFAINQLKPKQVDAIAKALGYSDVNELNTAIEGMDGNTVQAIAQALGITDVNTLKNAVNSMTDNTVHANAIASGKEDVDGLVGSVSAFHSYGDHTVTLTTVKQVIEKGVSTGASAGQKALENRNMVMVNGTAFANGATGKAYRQGDWGAKKTETALTGELGQELVVFGNRYWTVGDNGAEFTTIPKGAIVFNHKQTEEILANGKVTSGGGRGKVYANGTAFVQGTAFSSGTSGGIEVNAVTGGSYGKSSSSDDSKDDFEETIDWIETAIDRIERAIDNLDQKANNTYTSWADRNKALADQIGEVGEEINLQQQAYEKYMAAAEGVGLDEAYASKVRNGEINIETIKDETLANKIKSYQDWYEKALACQDAIEDLKETESKLYNQRFENVQTQYDGILQGYEHTEAMLNEYISQAEEQGHIVSKNYYQALIDNERENISQLENEQSALLTKRQEYYDAMREQGMTDEEIRDSEQWINMSNDIDGVTQAIEEGETAILGWGKSLEEIDWSVFDLMQERISAVSEEADFLIELMSNEKLFDDDGKLTSQGLATMALRAQKANTYMFQADEYGAEINNLNKEIEKDPYDQELINRRNELLKLQRESILAAEEEKNAIADMVEEGINLELDAMQELIDKKNEALESERDLYEYQKKVKEQTKEIASLEKQMAAYTGDNSEEARQKVQQISVELESARQELQETEYDKLISDTSSMLDTLYNEYELILNQRLDNMDYLLEQVIESVNAAAGADGDIATALGSEGAIAIAVSENATSIKDTLTSEAKNVGISLSSAMNEIWDTGEGNAKSVLTTYGEDFRAKSATIITTLNGIKSSVNNMVASLNKEAGKKVSTNKTSTSAKKNPTFSNSSTSNKSNSAGDGKPKVGDRVTFVDGQYYHDSQGDTPLGSKYKGKQVYITKISDNEWSTHPIHISTGNKLGDGDLGWLKLNQISGYATGKKNFLDDEIAWTQENGREFIVRPSDGAILTPVAKDDSILTSAASKNIWDMANSPAEFIKDNLNLGASNAPNNSSVQSNYTQNLENVIFSFPNVHSYDEMLSAMQRDKNFENLILSMTIDRIAGKSGLAKGKSIR